jgi:hypothetical protein
LSYEIYEYSGFVNRKMGTFPLTVVDALPLLGSGPVFTARPRFSAYYLRMKLAWTKKTG